jgi:hypothetical protein
LQVCQGPHSAPAELANFREALADLLSLMSGKCESSYKQQEQL